MTILLLLDVLSDLILFLLNTSTTILLSLYRSTDTTTNRNQSSQNIVHLHVARSVLLLQKDAIQRRIEAIDESIKLFHQLSNTQDSAETTAQSAAVLQHETSHLPVEQRTPPRNRTRSNTRYTNIGKPYPLPYTPPRTPDEERRNRIIEWVNDLRKQHRD